VPRRNPQRADSGAWAGDHCAALERDLRQHQQQRNAYRPKRLPGEPIEEYRQRIIDAGFEWVEVPPEKRQRRYEEVRARKLAAGTWVGE
jgi:hypothetical protein